MLCAVRLYWASSNSAVALRTALLGQFFLLPAVPSPPFLMSFPDFVCWILRSLCSERLYWAFLAQIVTRGTALLGQFLFVSWLTHTSAVDWCSTFRALRILRRGTPRLGFLLAGTLPVLAVFPVALPPVQCPLDDLGVMRAGYVRARIDFLVNAQLPRCSLTQCFASRRSGCVDLHSFSHLRCHAVLRCIVYAPLFVRPPASCGPSGLI